MREVVETMEAQINQLASKGEALEKRAKEAEAQLTVAQRDLERVLPFEKEVKEKNLLIGKLRHEGRLCNVLTHLKHIKETNSTFTKPSRLTIILEKLFVC